MHTKTMLVKSSISHMEKKFGNFSYQNKNRTHVDDVRPPPNANVAVPIVRPYAVIVASDHVRAVASSTICDLDFQPSADNRCTPI